MAPSIVHLPNGHNLTVMPVFGGLSFKASEPGSQSTPLPPGWTVVLHTEDGAEDHEDAGLSPPTSPPKDGLLPGEGKRKRHIHRYTRPTLKNDHLFISSISNPATSDPTSAVSPTRQIAMMLWATLWWYFHQPAPALQMDNTACASTVQGGRPKGDWKIHINREGIFKGRHLLQKLERMGLVVNEDSSVGLDVEGDSAASWSEIYITRRHFWHLDPRIFLFTPAHQMGSPFPGMSPANSRPGSPSRAPFVRETSLAGALTPASLHSPAQWSTTDPFASTSHLPTYFPPAPAHYTWTGRVRHPHRQKPPRQGEVFYTRYIPSLESVLSFRVASLGQHHRHARGATPALAEPSDVELLHKWMNIERVARAWGEAGPIAHQQAFLEAQLQKKHSFPVIASFDDRPFAYFEIYWVKEDDLGQHISGTVGDWDRGFHLLVGEEEFRGPHRVRVWLSALAHYCFLADQRTNAVMLEPRVDNEKVRKYCEEAGFFKEREITFPWKQSNLMKMYRDTFEAPCL